ncbi:hypothetical protein BKA93DRAFT_816646 [Sparassis latifolia]
MHHLALLFALVRFASAQTSSPTAIASHYSLSSSTSLKMPTATLAPSSASAYITSTWSVQGNIDGAADLAFVPDPFPSTTSSATSTAKTTAKTTAKSTSKSTSTPTPTPTPVLRVTYPNGSFSHPGTAGAQFYSYWSPPAGKQWQSMLLAYDVAFDTNFTWVLGGKLPGLRGGANTSSCSGGSAANGSNCFTSRLMWRTGGAGEVYSYFLLPNGTCTNSHFICNSDGYGTSIDRGSFNFNAGQWNRISLLVRMNSPVNVTNGQVALYHNDVQALSESSLQYRNNSAVNIGGIFFSTSSWAPPNTTHSYFRNFQLWGSTAPA